MNYFNTTNLKDVEQATKKATKQDEKIHQLFKSNPTKGIIASVVWCNSFDVDSVPLTSVRRSINTLHNKGKIKRIYDEEGKPTKVTCPLYGKKVFIYKLNR